MAWEDKKSYIIHSEVILPIRKHMVHTWYEKSCCVLLFCFIFKSVVSQKLHLKTKGNNYTVFIYIRQWVSFCSVILLSHAFSKLWTDSSILSHPDFLNWPHEANPLKLLESVFFYIWDSFPVHLQIAAGFQAAHLLLEPWFRFLIRGPFDKRGKEEAEEEGEAREKILIECSPPDNEFSPPFKCICRMLEWFITADSEVWQWTSEMSDGIFLLISFPWSSLSPWPVYLY